MARDREDGCATGQRESPGGPPDRKEGCQPCGPGALVVKDNGKQFHYAYLERMLERISPKPIRFHYLRYTYATLRIGKGDNILDVSKQLGHHKAAFTPDRYAHSMLGEHKTRMDALDTLHPAAPGAD